MRSLARECVFKYIFSKLFNQQDEGLFAHLCNELNNEDKDFANLLLSNVEENQQKYLDKIEELSENFRLSRVVNTDKCALLIGMAELDNINSQILDQENILATATTDATKNTSLQVLLQSKTGYQIHKIIFCAIYLDF